MISFPSLKKQKHRLLLFIQCIFCTKHGLFIMFGEIIYWVYPSNPELAKAGHANIYIQDLLVKDQTVSSEFVTRQEIKDK